MTLTFGAWEESYPPEVLRGYTPPGPPMQAAARHAAAEPGGEPMEPTSPPPSPGPESNSPEGAVPVESTRTEPDGPAVVAVPPDQLEVAGVDEEPEPEVAEANVQVAEESTPKASAEEIDDEEGPRYTVTAGTPGGYAPDVSASDRPRNVTELRSSARSATAAPWPAGAYVLVGTTGKRAHWSGDDWHTGESPGYGNGDDAPGAEK